LIYGNVYDALAFQSAGGKKYPGVAQSWSWNSDYTKLTLNLRQGIQFNNGWGELTSADVVYMFQQTMTKESVSGAKSFMTGIIDISAPNDYTVVVTQNASNTDNADSYAFSPVYASIPCKKYVQQVGWKEANVNPVGSGPYKLIERKTANYQKFEAVPNHWRVVPEFQYLIIKAVPEESTRIAMLKTGDIDATIIGPNSVTDLPASTFTIDNWPYGAQSAIMFGGLARPGTLYYEEGYHNTDPWANVKVREAMSISIDRDAINKALEKGTGTPISIVQPIPGADALPPIKFDPARARQLLKEAGFPNGFSFTLVSAPSHPGIPMIAKEAEAVVGYWSDVGIKATINPIDFPSYSARSQINKTKGECYTYRYVYGGANPYTMLMQLDKSDNRWGTRLQCEASDIQSPIAQAALKELDLTKRTALYKQLAQIQYDYWEAIPLLKVPYLMAKNKAKVGEWPADSSSYYWNFPYVRHAQPLNTFRLFTPVD